MNVFDLAAKITLDTSDYTSSLSQASQNTSNFGEKLGSGLKVASGVAVASITAVSAAIVGASKALFDLTSETAQYGDNVDKMSQKLGMSKEAYQEWSYVMNLAGTSIDNLQLGMKTLSQVVVEAGNGSDTANAKLRSLGLTINDLNGLSQEEQLNLVIASLQDMESGAERTAAATALLGRSAMDMAALLNMSANETELAKQEAHEYGMIMNDEAVLASAKFQDSLTKLQGTFTGLKNRVFSEFLPSLNEIVDGLSDLLAGNDNAMDDISSGIEHTITTVVDKMPALLDTVERMLLSIVSGVVSNAPKIIQVVVNTIITLSNEILNMLPTLIQVAGQIITTLITGITQALPNLIPTLVGVVLDIVNFILSPENLNMLLNAIISLISGLANGILDAIPIILDALPTIIDNVITFITNAIPELLSVILSIVQRIISMEPDIIRSIVSMIPPLINAIIAALKEDIPVIISTGIELFNSLLDGRLEIISTLVDILPDIIISLVDAMVEYVDVFIDAWITLFTAIVENIPIIISKIVDKMPDIINGIVNGFVKLKDKFVPMGKALIDGIVDGLTNNEGWLYDKLTGWGNRILDSIKGVFGIHSPSTEMEWVGEMLMDGLTNSITENGEDAVKAMARVSDKIYDANNDLLSGLDYSVEQDYRLSEPDYLVRSVANENSNNKNITVILELDRTQLAKTMFTLNNEEAQRLGVKLANV